MVESYTLLHDLHQVKIKVLIVWRKVRPEPEAVELLQLVVDTVTLHTFMFMVRQLVLRWEPLVKAALRLGSTWQEIWLDKQTALWKGWMEAIWPPLLDQKMKAALVVDQLVARRLQEEWAPQDQLEAEMRLRAQQDRGWWVAPPQVHSSPLDLSRLAEFWG